MNSWIKKILIGIIVVIILCIVGGFIYSKSHNSPVITKKNENVSNQNIQTVKDVNIPKVEEPTVLIPKKENSIPPKEPVLPEGTDRFVVPLNSTNEMTADSLLQSGFITDTKSFLTIVNKDKTAVSSGAYKLSKIMTPAQINKVLHLKPYMKWVMIKPGLRKEEIATILSDTLGWTSKQKSNWILKDTTVSPEYTEGVYYPDTYLVPVSEEPALVAKRLIAKFNEKFASYLPQFTAKNIKWTRALTLASIVHREAANADDMPLIAGILWNRLNQNMSLGIDATLQYVRGDVGKGWWAPITIADKQTDSPFNTYKYKGLPPHPISNPGVIAVEAVLNPTKTDCLYYLHDKNRLTHCAVTYEEHQQNIQKYLVSGVTSNN
jgi:UPF0755 protein